MSQISRRQCELSLCSFSETTRADSLRFSELEVTFPGRFACDFSRKGRSRLTSFEIFLRDPLSLRPILDRGVRFDRTSLEDAARYALISLDSTMRSNVTVGSPVDLLVYTRDDLRLNRHLRFAERDPDLVAIHTQWEQALRVAVQSLPSVKFDEPNS